MLKYSLEGPIRNIYICNLFDLSCVNCQLDYELDAHLVKPSVLLRTTMDDWLSNLNTIIKWSPYSSEQQLLSQVLYYHLNFSGALRDLGNYL